MKNEVRQIDANELVKSLKNRRLHILLENENDGAGVFDDIVDWIKYTPEISWQPARIDREAWEPCGECAPNCWNCVDSDADEDTYPMTCQCCVNHNRYRSRFKFCSECGRPLTEEA